MEFKEAEITVSGARRREEDMCRVLSCRVVLCCAVPQKVTQPVNTTITTCF